MMVALWGLLLALATRLQQMAKLLARRHREASRVLCKAVWQTCFP